ncbi:actin-related protein 10-like [Mya arenaria]|uniref:actin-related protein 10-like n=1 Tax=Mya arenaria TaxID=6604 RepID=UPI0022E4F9F3|nr:actin-related protein 10-like [Mya arenaria]
MPLYEGISYSSDKNVVILDIGAAYTKCGLAGESCPRCIIPSQLKDDKTGQIRPLWEFKKEDELFENLKDFLFQLYFRHLLMNAKDRRVVVCESLLCPAVFRETLARVLFKHFEVGSVMFTPGHLTSLLTLGVYSGLVMDVGYTETLVVPVYEGIPVLKAIQSLPLAGRAIHKRIKEMLLKDGRVKCGQQEFPLTDKPELLTEEILEDIKVRCCFVTKLNRAGKIHAVTMRGEDESSLPAPPPDVWYPLDGDSSLHVSGKVREHACEVMFEQDNELQSISTLLLDAIVQCPIDTRVKLSQNIVITGGTSQLPGFLHRVQLELQKLLREPRYSNILAVKKFKYHVPPCKANYTAWLGGAMFGSLETLPSKSVSRDQYIETGKISDWCSLDTQAS